MLKRRLQPYLKKIEPWASRFPFHPALVTVSGLAFALAGFLAVWIRLPPLYGFVLFVLAFAADAVDGAVARAKKLESRQGAFLDGILDRVVEFFLIVSLWAGFSWTIPEQAALISILFFGTSMASFVKAYAEHSGLMRHREALAMPGILERPERGLLLLLIFGGLLLQIAVTIAVYLTAVLAGLTFIQRVGKALAASSGPAVPRLR